MQALEICDGHTIFDLDTFTMLPEFVTDHFSKECPSEGPGGHPQRTIYTDQGAVTGGLFGIYGLDLIVAAARAHGVSSPKNGRGTMANDLKEQLREKLAPAA